MRCRLRLGPFVFPVTDNQARTLQRAKITYWCHGSTDLELRPFRKMGKSRRSLDRDLPERQRHA